jgi:hypothetical protein
MSLTVLVLAFICFCKSDKSILFGTSSYVKEINAIEIFKELHLSPHTVLMLFYSSKLTDEHLDSIFDEYSGVAKEFENRALFAAINCELHKPDEKPANAKESVVYLSICNHFEIRHYPTLLMLKPREYEQIPDAKGGKSFLKRPTRYGGELKAAALGDWLEWAMEDIVQHIDSRPMLEAFLMKSFPESTKLIVIGETVEPPGWLNFVAQAVRPDSPMMKRAAFVGYCSDSALVFGHSLVENAQTSPTIVKMSKELTVLEFYSEELEFYGVKDWIESRAGEPLDFSKLTQKPIPKKIVEQDL